MKENLPKEKLLNQMFGRILLEGKNFQWVESPSFIPFVSRGIPILIFGIVWGIFTMGPVVDGSVSEGTISELLIFALFISPAFLCTFSFIRQILDFRHTKYFLSDRELIIQTGPQGTRYKAIAFKKVVSIEITVNMIERMLGVGTIRINSGETDNDRETVTDDLIGIKNPYQVFAQLNQKTIPNQVKFSR